MAPALAPAPDPDPDPDPGAPLTASAADSALVAPCIYAVFKGARYISFGDGALTLMAAQALGLRAPLSIAVQAAGCFATGGDYHLSLGTFAPSNCFGERAEDLPPPPVLRVDARGGRPAPPGYLCVDDDPHNPLRAHILCPALDELVALIRPLIPADALRRVFRFALDRRQANR